MRREYDLDDDEMVPDGRSLKVPLALMDSVQRRFAFDANNHRPHFAEPTYEERTRRQATRDSYIEGLTTAWKRSPRTTEDRKDPNLGSFSDARPQLDAADAQARKNAAYRERNRLLANAWRGDAAPKPDDDPDDDTDNNDQARREKAYSDYVQRLQNSWRATVGAGPGSVGPSPGSVGPGPTRGGR
jgi:hypothetical protein